MGIKDEFAKFGAIQKNVQWSVSAFNDKGELVVSLWNHNDFFEFIKSERKQVYTDNIHRWSGLGRDEMKRNLDIAWQKNAVVRVVLSQLKNREEIKQIQAGADASKFAKIFNARSDWYGKLLYWDGAKFQFEFTQDVASKV